MSAQAIEALERRLHANSEELVKTGEWSDWRLWRDALGIAIDALALLQAGRADALERVEELREALKRVNKITADEAWEIAAKADCPPAVCLQIEALSDDPSISGKIIEAAIDGRAAYNGDKHGTE